MKVSDAIADQMILWTIGSGVMLLHVLRFHTLTQLQRSINSTAALVFQSFGACLLAFGSHLLDNSNCYESRGSSWDWSLTPARSSAATEKRHVQ